MKVEHLVEVEVVLYCSTTVEDDTDHPMTDDQIGEIAKKRILKYGPNTPMFDTTVSLPLMEEDIRRVAVQASYDAETGEDVTDDFIDLQRKMKKEA